MATQDWITVTVDDLNDYVVGRGVAAMRTKALAAGQSDPFQNTMETICTRIRAEIGKRYVLSATDFEVPQDLKWCACLLICEMMQSRLPGLRLNAGAEEQLKDARDYLKRVNRGDVWIAASSDPAPSPILQSEVAAQVVRRSCRRVTSGTMANI